MSGEITRIVSRNHNIKTSYSEDKRFATITLSMNEDQKMIPTEDFVLLVQDSNINLPTAISSYDSSTKE
jgi:hypothetical protein